MKLRQIPTLLPALFITLYAILIFSENPANAQISVGTIKQVSIGSNNAVPSGQSGSPAIALNGKMLVFNSDASNLVAGDNNQSKDVFLTDLSNGATSRLSLSSSGVEGNSPSANPAISPLGPDGFFIVAFESEATNLSSIISPNPTRDITVRIPSLSFTEKISFGVGGLAPNGNSRFPSATILMSPNRGLIAFESDASNLIVGDANEQTDIFLATLTSPSSAATVNPASLVQISRISSATRVESNGNSEKPQLSGNGSFVVFTSSATNLIDGVQTLGKQVFRYDVASKRISLLSKNGAGVHGEGDSYGASISYSGRFVSFLTEANTIATGASPSTVALVVLDTVTGTLTRANSDQNGVAGDGSVLNASIGATGRFLTFSDSSSNLVPSDNNGVEDVFIKDLSNQQISRVSLGEISQEGNALSDLPTFAGNGFTSSTGTLVYRSFATNLTAAGLSSGSDIFSNSATLSPLILQKNASLEVPPDVALKGKKAILTFEKFLSTAAVTLSRSSKISTQYDVRINKITKKSKEISRKISKKNQIAVNKLKPGNYSARYRALTVKGKKTIKATKFSPIQKFTIGKPS